MLDLRPFTAVGLVAATASTLAFGVALAVLIRLNVEEFARRSEIENWANPAAGTLLPAIAVSVAVGVLALAVAEIARRVIRRSGGAR